MTFMLRCCNVLCSESSCCWVLVTQQAPFMEVLFLPGFTGTRRGLSRATWTSVTLCHPQQKSLCHVHAVSWHGFSLVHDTPLQSNSQHLTVYVGVISSSTSLLRSFFMDVYDWTLWSLEQVRSHPEASNAMESSTAFYRDHCHGQSR